MEEEWEMFQRAMKEESHVSSLLFYGNLGYIRYTVTAI
jgi:hypothetical protein